MGPTPPLPGPVRAAVGLLAAAADEAKRLPDRAVELPMLAVSTALQISLRAQQRYAQLTARGDEILNAGPVTDDPPAWATFDEPVEDRDTDAAEDAAEDIVEPAPDGADEPVPAKAAKSVRRPRKGKPSAFDVVDD